MTVPLTAPTGTSAGRRRLAAALVVALAAAAVLLQVSYPLVSGEALRRLTIASVLVFAAASLAHAVVSRGPRYAAVLLVVALGGACSSRPSAPVPGCRSARTATARRSARSSRACPSSSRWRG